MVISSAAGVERPEEIFQHVSEIKTKIQSPSNIIHINHCVRCLYRSYAKNKNKNEVSSQIKNNKTYLMEEMLISVSACAQC